MGNKQWSIEQIRIAGNVLFIHLSELLVATCRSQTGEQTKVIPVVNEREHGPLFYLMGLVFSKMFQTSKSRKKSMLCYVMLESILTNRKELQDLLQSKK